MKLKRTKRIFTVNVPNGTKTEKIRTLLRAADGTDYPVDREIEVPTYETKTVELIGYTVIDPTPDQLTEKVLKTKLPEGTLFIETKEVVDYVEVK